ncbi:hypothetical protein SAMN05428989_1055 [Pseudoxanthomonas sp. GM95]|uniref:hypothetical protein n=1 Tax=Pseudoxanthomonas sp. GM95 TaxID=1881043 RepID=UPI0008B5181E|nr:hypothetical protein [Pseudoxanthomonas sp. GM95]SEK91149.1 hypothetical protein SAMN05428989_1055 [Pseudoxanthomonas sp. GM95]
MPPWLLKALVVAGIVWTLPNSAIGVLLGLAGMLRGAQVHLSRREYALVFSCWPWGPGGAITFGNTIVQTGASLDVSCHTYAHTAGRCIEPPVRLGDHERAHVFQYMVLGPLFLPAYLLCGGISVRNRFERAADRYALTGRAWWPTRMSR